MSISEIIQQAVFAIDVETRTSAEKKLYELLNANPSIFLKNVCEQLVKESNESNLRQAAAAIIKRCILLTTGDEVNWLKFDSELKKTIKTYILGNLITKDPMVMKTTADIISVIASIEIPRNEWSELIPLLIKNLNEYKKAAIATLGYICEKLKQTNNGNCIDHNTKEMILMGILFCLNQNETNDVKLISIKALQDSLNMMEPAFEKKETTKYFIGLLLENCKDKDSTLVISTLQCLIDFCKMNIARLEEYSESLLQIISPLVLDNNSEIAIPAIELWITLAEEEKDNAFLKTIPNFSFMGKIANNLIPLLLQNLLKKPEDEEDDEEEEGLSIQASSFRCLCVIVELLGDLCLDQIANFVSNCISSENIYHKKASLYAFCSLMDGPSSDKINNLITKAFIPILALLFDPNLSLRKTSALTISRMAEFHPITILNLPKFNEILVKIMEALHDKPCVSKKICHILGFISEGLKKVNENNIFVSQIESIINTLLKNSIREDLDTKDMNLIQSTFTAVMSIIHNLQNPQIIEKYLQIFVDQAKMTDSIPANKRDILLNGILSAIHACLLRLAGRVNDNQSQEIYQIVIMNFQKEKKVTLEGIHIVSALANSIKNNFKKYLNDYVPYLDHALKSVLEPDILKAAIGNISDLCRACESEFEQYLSPIVPALLTSLNSLNFDKNLKLSIFLCFGDIAIGCPKVIIPYLENILSIYDSAFQSAAMIALTANSETLDYIDDLKENLIESFTCFVHSFSNTLQAPILLAHFPKLIEFIQFSCDTRFNPTITYIRNCLNLIGDIGYYYRSKVTTFVKIATTQNLMNILKKYTSDEENKYTIHYVTQVIQTI